MRARLVVAIALVLGACASPPPIPHAISQTSETWCVTCHLDGEDDAPISSHPDRLNCVGCHRQLGSVDVGAWAPTEVLLTRP